VFKTQTFQSKIHRGLMLVILAFTFLIGSTFSQNLYANNAQQERPPQDAQIEELKPVKVSITQAVVEGANLVLTINWNGEPQERAWADVVDERGKAVSSQFTPNARQQSVVVNNVFGKNTEQVEERRKPAQYNVEIVGANGEPLTKVGIQIEGIEAKIAVPWPWQWWCKTSDSLSGTPSADFLIGDDSMASRDTIWGYAENDIIRGLYCTDYLYGHTGQDVIFGGYGNDYIYGNEDEDALFGNSGNDFVRGNQGDDAIVGGSGHDRLYGDDGNDRIRGGDHTDRIYGGNGDDDIHGDEHNDYIYGQNGEDAIYGDGGNDYINGGANDDVIYGGDGNDTIDGGPGIDVCFGGPGNDTFSNCETVFQ